MWRQIVRSIPHQTVRSIPYNDHLKKGLYWELTTPQITYTNRDIRHIDNLYSTNIISGYEAYRVISSPQKQRESIEQWIRRNYLLQNL